MFKYIIVFAGLFLSIQLMAQTGIGTTTPHASAKLDVSATNKGFLPPRVTLTSNTDATTIPSPAEGLIVYNLGSAGLQAGYYYWNGANWATIATATSAGNGVTSMDMVKLYGEAHSKASGKIGNSTTGFVFSVPVSGRYLFDFTSAATTLNAGTNTIYFTVRQGTTVLASDMQSSYNNNVHVEYNGKVEVNLQAGVNYNVYNYATSGSFETNDYDRVYYKLVAGNLPVTGQSVEYGIARYTGSDGSSLSANAIVAFDATAAGNLAWSGNKFTLKANKTYELESYLAVYHASAGVAGVFQIYNYTNSTVLANGLYLSINGVGGYNVNANGPMRCVITPSTDIEVGVRISTAYGGWPSIVGSTNTIGANGAANQSYLLVKQIGSSAIINPWTLSGTNTFNTTGNVGIGNNAPTAKLDVTGSLGVSGTTTFRTTGGDEGGEIEFGVPQTNTTLSTRVVADVWQNRFRIFDGNTKGVYIDLSKSPTGVGGELLTKASGFVNAGDYVTLGNIRARIPTSGNRSLQIATLSGTYSIYGSGIHVFNSNVGSTTIGPSLTISTTPAYLNSGNTFNSAGGTDTWNIMDTTNFIGWRISCIIGASYNSNLITIERLF